MVPRTPRTPPTTLLLRALSFAAARHSKQTRKGADPEPYVNHLITTARLVAEHAGVTDPDILVAAVLHDVVEDTPTSLDEIRERFGATVAGYVGEVSDDKSLPKERRKELQVEHAPHISRGAKLIKLADKLTNVEDLVRTPPAGWTLARKLEYVDWAVAVVAALRPVDAALEAAFDAVAAEVRATLEAKG